MNMLRLLNKTLLYGFIVIVIVFFIFPIYWIATMSFKQNVEIFEIPPKFLVLPRIDSYVRVFQEADFVAHLTSSVLVAGGTILLTFSCGTFAAYSLSRFNFRGKELLKFVILSFRMMPPVALLIPLFVIFLRIHLLNTRIGLIVTYTAFLLPFTIWMLMSYFAEIPKEIDESAFIDGCGYLKIMLIMIIPLSAPGMAAIAILVFGWSWNEYLLASLLTRSSSRTLPLVIQYFLGEHAPRWNDVSAVCIIMVVPIVVGIMFFQRYMVRGLTFGAVKE